LDFLFHHRSQFLEGVLAMRAMSLAAQSMVKRPWVGDVLNTSTAPAAHQGRRVDHDDGKDDLPLTIPLLVE
jgi:hypothetical protein